VTRRKFKGGVHNQKPDLEDAMSKNGNEVKTTDDAMATITLTVAERQLVSVTLSDNKKMDVDIARRIRAMRKALALREAEEEVEKMTEEAHKIGATVSWDDINKDPAYFTVVRTDLRWLQERVREKDWTKARDQQGNVVEVTPPIAMICALADLADSIAAALS
jgi:hypothetical protein